MKGGKDMGMNNTALNPMDTDTRVTRIIADTEVKTPTSMGILKTLDGLGYIAEGLATQIRELEYTMYGGEPKAVGEVAEKQIGVEDSLCALLELYTTCLSRLTVAVARVYN